MNIISSFAWISQFTLLGKKRSVSSLRGRRGRLKMLGCWPRSLAVSDCMEGGSQKALCAADISAPRLPQMM